MREASSFHFPTRQSFYPSGLPVLVVSKSTVLEKVTVTAPEIPEPILDSAKEPADQTPLETVKSGVDAIPKWAIGAGVGGALVLASVGVGVGHNVAKHARKVKAHELAVEQAANEFFNNTPRAFGISPRPESMTSPREPERPKTLEDCLK